MPSFSDSIFLFILALLLFGPKKLPVLARELGKWVGEFRRASNEFKMQMEDELRVSEQADRQKQIAAMEAAAPVSPALGDGAAMDAATTAEGAALESTEAPIAAPLAAIAAPATTVIPMPIATSGERKIMPPATGLPQPRTPQAAQSPLGGLLGAIPEVPNETAATQETVLHGD